MPLRGRHYGRAVVLAAALTTMKTQFAVAQPAQLDLMRATVTDIQKAVAAGTLTYERLVEMYLARIAAYEKAGPKLNAIIQVNPRAIEVARALDRERREGQGFVRSRAQTGDGEHPENGTRFPRHGPPDGGGRRR